MTSDETIPEADRLEGAPHPRQTALLVGQREAENAFLAAYNSGRLHHAWLITGPNGVGKATLAWRIARFLLAQPVAGDGGLFGAEPEPATSLDISEDHPVARRMAALAEPRLFLLRRPWDEKRRRLKQVITVDEVRQLGGFFHLSAADGGRRVVIVDAADEMNANAANALLKLLEEPPEGAVLLLVSHQPSRLLPTIRSRCRELRCRPLGATELAVALPAAEAADAPASAEALAELSGGSVGEAVRLSKQEGMHTYGELIALLSDLPQVDRAAALALAESTADRNAPDRFDLLARLIELFLARTARTGVSGPPLVEAANGERDLMVRICPNVQAARLWAELQQTISERIRRGKSVNLDPSALMLDALFRIRQTAQTVLAANPS